MHKYVSNALLWGLCGAVAAGCGGGDDAGGSAVARQIEDPVDLIGGSDPVGGLGDWYLANNLVEAIIDDVHNQNGLAPSGGTLVDFAHLGAD